MQKKVRNPKQKRSLETKQKIIKTAEKLFYKKGYHGTNSNEIAANAGVSIGSFYSYFKDKKAVYIEIIISHKKKKIESIIKYQKKEIKTVIEAKSFISNLIHEILKAHSFSVQFHRDTAVLKYSDTEVSKIYNNQEKKTLEEFEACFELIKDYMRISDLKTASRVALTTIEDFVHAVKFHRPKHEEKKLISELTDMINLYLFK